MHVSRREIGRYFLKLGFLGFGGPLAIMAAVQKDLVEDRKWTERERFAQGLALIKALPGPTATQVAIYMGQIVGGRMGGFIAGIALILPAFFMMILLAAFYGSVETLEWSKPVLFGMQSAALGIIVESVWKLSKPYKSEKAFWLVMLFALIATIIKPSFEPVVILGSGFFGMLLMKLNSPREPNGNVQMFGLIPAGILGIHRFSSDLVLGLSATMFKAGAFVFGTGLAIVPMLEHDVVNVKHWLTQRQFLDALAFGQITPGPVMITSTFIGFRVAGLLGAVAATVCIFAPAFFNILTWFPLAEKKLGSSAYTKKFVMWAVGAVCGSILVTVGRLAISSHDYSYLLSAAVGTSALLLALRTRIPVWIIIPAGGLVAPLWLALQR